MENTTSSQLIPEAKIPLPLQAEPLHSTIMHLMREMESIKTKETGSRLDEEKKYQIYKLNFKIKSLKRKYREVSGKVFKKKANFKPKKKEKQLFSIATEADLEPIEKLEGYMTKKEKEEVDKYFQNKKYKKKEKKIDELTFKDEDFKLKRRKNKKDNASFKAFKKNLREWAKKNDEREKKRKAEGRKY